MNFTFNLELFCVFLAILGGFVDQNERGFQKKNEGKRIQNFSRETNGVSIIDISLISFSLSRYRVPSVKNSYTVIDQSDCRDSSTHSIIWL